MLPKPIRKAVAKRIRGADVRSAALLGAGIATNAYQMESSTGPWVVRISNEYPEPWRWRGGRGYEVPLLTELAERGLPVPQDPFAIDAEDGLPVAIVERKVGGAPAHRADDRLAAQVAEFLTALHQFPAARARALGVPEPGRGIEYRNLLSFADPILSAPVRGWLEAQIAEIDGCAVPGVLVHGDVRAEHLYRDPDGRLVGVIDFGDVVLGDPAYDFFKLGAGFADQLLGHYGGAVDSSFRARIAAYEALELLWEVARPDATDEERAAALVELDARAGA